MDSTNEERKHVHVVIRRAVDFMKKNIDSPITLDNIAEEARCCKYSLIRTFNQHLGSTPMRWLWSHRLERGWQLLQLDPPYSIHEVVQETGFSSIGHFTSAFKKRFGMTPAFFRDHTRNADRYESQILDFHPNTSLQQA